MSQQVEQEQPVVIFDHHIAAMSGMPLHRHPRGQFYFVKQGALAVVNQQGRFIAAPGHGIWVPAELEHQVIAKTDASLAHFYFAPELCPLDSEHCIALQGTGLLSGLVNEALNIPKDYQWASIHGRILRLLSDYIFLAKPLDTYLPYPHDKRLLQITERLQKHPSIKSDLVAWGKFVNASSRTLSRRFKKETGITYSEWRQRLNIQIAIKHLVLGDSISDIAHMLGYESSSAFIYMFKKQTGVTPNNYIK
ncbi:helix-turn-helix domain-containing protein [Thalassotalea ganghwensis]